MTVLSETARNQYNCDGSQTVFPYTFRILDETHLRVVLTDSGGNETDLVLNTDYTVDGVGDDAGGNVTTAQAYDSGYTLTIVRDVPLTQETDYVENDPFPAESHENALDKLTMIIQQVKEILNRTPKLSVSSTLSDIELPEAADRAIAWNSDGDALTTVAITDVVDPAWDSLSNYNDSLADMVIAIGSGKRTVLIHNTPTDLTSDLTIPENIHLIWLKGCPVNIAAGVTLTINGQLEAGKYQIFSGDGSIRFADGMTIESAWFSDFGTAIAKIGSDKVKLIISEPTNVSDDVTVNADTSLCFPSSGCILTVSAGKTLTINGTVEAGCYQIFSGDGLVTGLRFAYPEWFGAVGGGTTDDQVAIQKAINALVSGTLKLKPNVTYRVDSTLTLKSYIKIQGNNATIDFSNANTGDYLFELEGSLGSGISLSSDASAGDETISLSDTTGLSEGDYVYIYSSALWDDVTNATCGEIGRIKSVGTDTITLYSPLLGAYATADSAAVKKISPVEEVEIVGLNAVGSGPGGEQKAIYCQYGSRIVINGCSFDLFDDRSIQLNKCIYSVIRNVKATRSERDGLAYGLSIAEGCHWIDVHDCFFEDVRHGVTIGGTDGVNRFINIRGCNIYGSADAGIDAHPAADFCTIIGNSIECISSGQDGIVYQGKNLVCTNNQILNPSRHGIIYQMMVNADGSLFPSAVISNNIIRNPGDIGIYVYNQGSVAIRNLTVSGNSISQPGTYGIEINSDAANMMYITVSGNNIYLSGSHGMYLTVPAGHVINFVTISGNAVRVNSSSVYPIYLYGADANSVRYVTIGANTLFGGDYSVRGSNTENIAVVGNVLMGYGTGATSLDGSSNVTADNVT